VDVEQSNGYNVSEEKAITTTAAAATCSPLRIYCSSSDRDHTRTTV